MATFRRSVVPGATYFFTVNTHHRMKVLTNPWNPMKHGYVGRVRDWPYSSFHRYVKKGLYPLDWASENETNDARENDYGEPQ